MKRIPPTNNAGQARVILKAAQIEKNSSFHFRAAVVRRFMSGKAFRDFVKSYEKVRRVPRGYRPTKRELKIFAEYSAGRLTLEKFQKRLKIGSVHNTFARIGKIYDYTTKENRN